MPTYWINDLSGPTNQHTSPALLGNNDNLLVLNASQEYQGIISNREGSVKFLDLVDASNPVNGLGMYIQPDSTFNLHMVVDGDVYIDGETTWTAQATGEFSAGYDISMVNFIDRHYMASEGEADIDYVKYFTDTGSGTFVKIASGVVNASTSGTTLISVEPMFQPDHVDRTVFNTTDNTSAVIDTYVSSTQVTLASSIGDSWDGDNIEIRLDAQYLAVNGPYMMAVAGRVYPRRNYFTNVDSDVVTTITDYFISDVPATGVTSFGNNRAFIVFTRLGYTVVDPATQISTPVDGFGCVSNKSIQVVRGNLIWFGNDAIYMLNSISGYPIELSLPIKNNVTKQAYYNKIDKNNLRVVASGQYEDKYYAAVRNLSSTLFGETIDAAILEFDTTQQTWRIFSYAANDLANVMATFINGDGDTDLYAGSFTEGCVYKLTKTDVVTDQASDNNTTPITATVIVKDYEFGNSKDGTIDEELVQRVHFRYKASEQVTVSYAINGSSTYTQFDSTLPVVSATEWDWNYLYLGRACKTIRIKYVTTGTFRMLGIGFEVDPRQTVNLKGL